MHGSLPVEDSPAISSTATDVSKAADIGSQQTFTDNFCEGWFASLIKPLLPKDAGLHLHYITGFKERTCYRYASSESQPPAYFLRALLRSEQGEQFLTALMAGCDAKWWNDRQLKLRCADAYEQKRQRPSAPP